MTDVMVGQQAPGLDRDLEGLAGGERPPEALDAVDEQLIARLAGRARAGGLQLTGEGGLLAQLTKRLVESPLEGEISDHLGYDKHDPAGRDGGNSRNGYRPKTVLTEVGRSRSTSLGTGTPRSSRGPSANASGGCPGSVSW